MTSKVRSPQLARWLERGALAAPIFTRPILMLALTLFFGVLAVYVYTLSRHFSPDSMAFAMTITRGDLSSRLFFQAEHVLFDLIAFGWYEIFEFFGYDGGALQPMQMLSAISGALGVALLFLCLKLILGRRADAMFVGLLIAIAVGSTNAYWYHSTEAEDQILANAVVIGAFLCLLVSAERLHQGFTWHEREVYLPVAAALALTALAALVHGTTILFAPTLLMALWQLRAPTRVLALAVVSIPALVLAVLIAIGSTALGLRSPAEFAGWFLSAPGQGVWGRISPSNVLRAVETWVNAVVYLQDGPEFRALLRGSLEWRNVLAVVTFFIVGLALSGAVAYGIRHRRASSRPWLVPVLLVWIGVPAVFNLYWAPEDIQFWMATVPPLAILAALAYVTLVQRQPNRLELINSACAFSLAFGFVVNLATAAVQRSDLQTNVGFKKALCVGTGVGPSDLVIGPGWDWTTSYIPYFTGRQTVGIVDVAVLEAGRDPAALQHGIRERIERVWAGGGQAYLVRLPSLNEEDRAWLQRAAGFAPEQFPYPVKRAFNCGDEVVWQVQRG